jgi:uncharacterized protein (UPF0261 family)
VAPGNIDFFVHGPYEKAKKLFPDRPHHVHNPAITVMRYNRSEFKKFGIELAKKLNLAQGPVAVIIPLKGFSAFDKPEHSVYDPEANAKFTRALKANIRSSIPVIEVDGHINDPVFSNKVLDVFFELVK